MLLTESEHVAAHGPLHPALVTSKLIVFCSGPDVLEKGFRFGSLFRLLALRKCVWFFEPFKLRALFRFLALVSLFPWGGVGSIVPMTFL